MQTEENVAAPAVAASSADLNAEDVPIGTPLAWPIVDADGSLLFDRGAVVIGPDERRFLFEHFKPRRGGPGEAAHTQYAAVEPDAANDDDAPLSLQDTHLSIGALIGLRPQNASGPMQPSRIIGF